MHLSLSIKRVYSTLKTERICKFQGILQKRPKKAFFAGEQKQNGTHATTYDKTQSTIASSREDRLSRGMIHRPRQNPQKFCNAKGVGHDRTCARESQIPSLFLSHSLYPAACRRISAANAGSVRIHRSQPLLAGYLHGNQDCAPPSLMLQCSAPHFV